MEKLIEMREVTKDFLQGDDIIRALRKTDFAAEAGTLTAVIGPSGSGKSTFLTILGGLQAPTTGEVDLDGKPFSRLGSKARAAVRLRKIGFILQASNLIPFLTVREQLLLSDRVLRKPHDLRRLEELMDRLGIAKLERKFPDSISGGERQRVAIAKALYHNPDVILADEPTASLDSQRSFEVIRLLARETRSQRKATVMVTHDERLIEYCDKAYVIIDGMMTEYKPGSLTSASSAKTL